MRCFLAVEIPETVKKQIGKTIAALSVEWHAAPIRWVQTKHLHLTLHFLGANVEPDAVQLLIAHGTDLVDGTAPIALALGGVGTWPPNQRLARVVYVKVGGPGVQQLDAVRNRFAKLLTEFKIPVDCRPWHPHLTIGRMRQPFAPPITPAHFASPTSFTVHSLTIFQSTLTPSGPVYQRLHVFPFHGTSHRRRPGE